MFAGCGKGYPENLSQRKQNRWHARLALGDGQNSNDYWTWPMNDSKNSSKGLLVLKCPKVLTVRDREKLTEYLRPIAEQMGLTAVVYDNVTDTPSQVALERVCVALEEIAQQGRAPEVSEAQIAPQALNARPTGLNSRPATPPPAPPAPAIRREQMFYPSNYGGKPLDNGNG